MIPWLLTFVCAALAPSAAPAPSTALAPSPALAPSAARQEPARPPAPPPEQKPLVPPLHPPIPGIEPQGGAASAEDRMRELFVEIESGLGRIDEQLYRAAANEVPPTRELESGLEKLLRAAKSDGDQVVQHIDELLAIAQQQSQKKRQSSGGGSGQQQPGQGQSPLDQPQQGQAERERTPTQPDPKADPQNSPGGSDPKNPSSGDKPPEQKTGNPTPPSTGGAHPPVVDSRDNWGELPETVRSVFTSQGGGDMPVEYRDWIDAYHRRLSRTR